MYTWNSWVAAITTALAEQVSLDDIKDGLLNLTNVSGRMEIIDEGQEFLTLVDYAHTPDSLDNALATLSEFAAQKIITVFGCGGDRDTAKRPVMGKIAAKHSDYVILTSDNPRTESPEEILKGIEFGIIEFGKPVGSYGLIVDRWQAIIRAMELARPGDVVFIAGKGPEAYQILKDQTIHFDDREEARAAIRAHRLL